MPILTYKVFRSRFEICQTEGLPISQDISDKMKQAAKESKLESRQSRDYQIYPT